MVFVQERNFYLPNYKWIWWLTLNLWLNEWHVIPSLRLQQQCTSSYFLDFGIIVLHISLYKCAKHVWTQFVSYNCHTLISSGDLCLMTCDLSLVLVRCLASIIRQFVKFQDMPKNQKNIDAQSVSFRDTPEIKWKHRCIIKGGSVTFRKSIRGWLCNPQGSVTLRKENKYRYEIRKFP